MQVVNRVQKLRKKAGLEPTDTVEVYFDVHTNVPGSDPSVLQRVFESQVCILFPTNQRQFVRYSLLLS